MAEAITRAALVRARRPEEARQADACARDAASSLFAAAAAAAAATAGKSLCVAGVSFPTAVARALARDAVAMP